MKHVPNALCVIRIAMIPALWVIALMGSHAWFAGALAFTWFTDAIDGAIARRFGGESKFGAKLDSVADNSVQVSMLGWVYLLRRELYTHYWYLIALLFALFAVSMILQYRRRAPLHTYANKATAWILAAFLLYTFTFGVKVVAMWITFGTLTYALLEGIVLLAAAPRVDEDTRYLWQRRNWVRADRPPAGSEEPNR
ncbi:MAG: CDP-alcohol phosphatidyltransferase family protein [Armatimonadetes bacterium]|nr:CDP-alcohol phosphatidyltransferase family protein [Armatimonadota bacterium]